MEKYTVLLSGVILRQSDNAFIPTDPLNSDYIAYLEWVDAGNIADIEPKPEPLPQPDRNQQLADLLAQAQALQAQIQALMKA